MEWQIIQIKTQQTNSPTDDPSIFLQECVCTNRSKFGENNLDCFKTASDISTFVVFLGVEFICLSVDIKIKPMSSPYRAQPVARMEECAKNSKCLHLKQRQNSQNTDCSAK